MVAAQALLTPATLFRLAVFGGAEECYALTMLTFVHFSDSIYNHPPTNPKSPTASAKIAKITMENEQG